MNIYTIEFLIKLKNATFARKEKIITPFNRLSLELVKCLYKEGFVQSFHLENNSNEQKITVFLRFFYNKGLLKDLKIISTPSIVRHLTLQDICKLNTRKSVMFFSTSKGILTTLDCKKYKLGGSLLFFC